jgi:hypothetical protein
VYNASESRGASQGMPSQMLRELVDPLALRTCTRTPIRLRESLRQGCSDLNSTNSDELRLLLRALSHDQGVSGKAHRKRKGQGATPKRKRARRTQQRKLPTLATGAFAGALASLPPEDWCKFWPEERTIMLKMTSKKVKDLVDKLRPPTVVA